MVGESLGTDVISSSHLWCVRVGHSDLIFSVFKSSALMLNHG